MIVLGIDTSGYTNVVGVTENGRVLADNRFPARTDTLEQIVDNIDVTLKEAGVSLKDVDGIGVGLGPGSWTGIKVGVTVGKMLAFSAGKPVAGIPTLEALAYGAEDKSIPVYAVISAGVKDMIYAARYVFKENEPLRDGEYYAGDVGGLSTIIEEPIVLCGQNAGYYRDVILSKNEPVGDKPEAKNVQSRQNNLHNVKYNLKNEPAGMGETRGFSKFSIKALENEPAGSWVGALAFMRFTRGEKDDPLALTPLYLKESTAKVFINRYQTKSA